MKICIRGGKVYDPANKIEGEIRDIWVENDRIIQVPKDPVQCQTIDATGSIIAPAGIEIHTHVTGYGLNAARQFLFGDSENLDTLVPPAKIAAQRYLSLGYTTIFEAAYSPLLAQLTIKDLENMDCLDRGGYTQLGDHQLLLQALAKGDRREFEAALIWLLTISGGYAVKLVNPGGGLAWKSGLPAPSLDEPIGCDGLTQRKIIFTTVECVNALGFPHPVHLHAGRLGEPGNADAFCETIHALEAQRAHLCHIQFYSYGKDSHARYVSAADRVVRSIMEYPQLTCDVGQIVFGSAMAVSFDTSGLSNLHKRIGQPWISKQLVGEGGVNVLPIDYHAKNPASAVQWATGLELMLSFPDPTRMFLTTDHPNGGPFTAYPQIIELLMNQTKRQEALEAVHPAGIHKTGLSGIKRELTLDEIFSMTSWGPAKALGLTDRGHLGVGALADIRCYQDQADIFQMFSEPVWVMKRGEIVFQNGQFINGCNGSQLVVRPAWDQDRASSFRKDLEGLISIPVECYGLGTADQSEYEEVACKLTRL